MSRPSIEEVLASEGARLLAVPGVNGIGEGQLDGKPCILVFVRRVTEEVRRDVPPMIGGYPVRIEDVGDVTARS